MTSKKASESFNGKYYFGGTKLRMEMNAAGHQSITITDINTKVVQTIMPDQKMYMEMNMNGMMMKNKMPDMKPYDPNNPCAGDDNVTCTKVGSELMNGRMTDKWQFTAKPGKKGVNRTVWIDKANHIPIKTVMDDGTTVEFKNIKEGPQPASLFQVPAGYQKMDMGNMMRGMKPPVGDND